MLKRGLKIAVALLLIALLVRGVDWQHTQQLLASVWLPALCALLVVMIGELMLSAWKWRWTLRMHALEHGFGYLLVVIAKGYFINNFLPTAVGGDAYRVYRTMPSDGFKSRAVSAVLLDRASGLCALLVWGAVAALSSWGDSSVARWYLGVCAAGALVALLMLWGVYKGALKPLTNRVRHLAAFAAVEHNLTYLLRARRPWLYVAALSLAFQASSILIIFTLFMVIGRPVDLSACALMAAAAGLAAVLPLSINGIGVMEGSLVGMAVALGVDYDAAVLVAILRRLLMVSLSILCGTIFLLDREPSPKSNASPAA